MNINEMADIAYKNAVRLGKIGDRGNIEKLKDLQSEYMEAFIALNNGSFADIEYFKEVERDNSFKYAFKETIHNTYEDELTDILCVTLSLMRDRGMDIEKHFKYKQKFNDSRKAK